ncbi:MAG: Hsp70 family protein, partial [Myxococcota bacterium]
MSARYIVGIDLGTTHTVVAYADTHLGVSPAEPSAVPSIHPFAIPQLVGPAQVETRALLPSARYHAANGELAPGALDLPWATGRDFAVGEFASDLGAKSPGRLVRSAKSWLSHDGVDRTAPILPWGAGRDVPQCSPLQASAGYLAHVKEAWNQAFPHEPLHAQDVVLTIPASFDETARSLTVKAAHEAGLPQVRLVEEPQAAFYRWMSVHQDDLDSALDGLRLVLVVDVGGGTTDLTLLRLEARETGPRVTRIAVGDHLMLGGDNMDLALAHLLEPRFGDRGLGSHAFGQLAYQCRLAKERMLHEAAPENVPVSVVGTGSKLIGGARSVSVDRQELQTTLLEGFFPQCEFETAPHKRRAAIVEFGLPYVADPAITHHVAAFLGLHQDLAREALGVAGPAADQGANSNAVPDAVLFNGGVFRSALLRRRMISTLGTWRGSVPRELESPSLELAVSAGAVAYGLARRKIGLRIGGGSARTYFLSTTTERPDEGIVLLPRFAEEGEEIVLEKRTFSLRLGKPV